MSTKIIKVELENLAPYDCCPFGERGDVYLGIYPQSENHYPIGVVSLSVRVGKNRKLVKGKIKSYPFHNAHSGVSYYEYLFTPSTDLQHGKLKLLGILR